MIDLKPRSTRKKRPAGLLLLILLFCALALPAAASVTLTTFEAAAQDNGTIRIHWASATELETAVYKLYRAESAAPSGGWGDPIHAVAAAGGVSPTSYEWFDPSVTAGVTYYYMLEDVSTGNVATPHGPISERVMLPGETATSTPTATATRTSVPTATTGPGTGGGVVIPTATGIAPTATRQFTNTPVAGVVETPIGGVAPTSPPFVQPSATPLPAASVATPTGQVLLATAPPLIAEATPTVFAEPPTLTPTVQIVAQAPEAEPATATPRPTREVTPIIFAAGGTGEPAATATAAQDVAATGGRNIGSALAIGGGALGLAGLLAAALLFLRSRKA